MQQTPYGVGIVGCGTISDTHAKAIDRSGRGKLVAACSRDGAKAGAFCKRHGGAAYSEYDAFLQHDGLDVVVVCTPSGTHLEVGKRAAEAGKHLIIEKPIEVSIERGRTLVESCESAGVQLAVIYQNRFIPDVLRMKQALEQGEIGRAFMVDASVKWYRDQAYYDQGGWRGTLKLDGGGAVINQSIHTVDLIIWMCGDVSTLHAFTGTFTHAGVEGEDNAVASLKFENGAIGLFRGSTSIIPPQDRMIEVHGTKGTAVLKGDRFHLIRENDSTDRLYGGGGSGAASPLSGMSDNHHASQYIEIFRAFRNGETPPVSGEESLRSLAVVEAMYESSRLQRPVEINR